MVYLLDLPHNAGADCFVEMGRMEWPYYVSLDIGVPDKPSDYLLVFDLIVLEYMVLVGHNEPLK